MSDPYHIPGGEVCKICGLTFYARSFGGPNICPSCDCGNFGQTAIQRQRDMIAALEQRLAASEQRCAELEQDARRYRWLRDTKHWEHPPVANDFTGTVIRGVKVTNYFKGSVVNVDWMEGCGDQLDALIDAALKEQKA